jgi:hypothetical protein
MTLQKNESQETPTQLKKGTEWFGLPELHFLLGEENKFFLNNLERFLPMEDRKM